MRFYIHYTIWNKAGHIPWICEGLRKSAPKKSVVDFVFDNCTDDSSKNVDLLIGGNDYGGLKNFKVLRYNSTKKLRWPNTNDAIKRFMKSDCDLFFSPQDDMKVQDKFVFENLETLYTKESNIGLVGMRDGIDTKTNQFYSSCHSPGGGTGPTIYLKSGEYQRVNYVNDGPICLDKNAVSKVGLFDLEYWAHFGDNDYCFRAEQQGLQNYVMGAEIVHEKWASTQQSEVWSQEYSLHDHEIYNRKWGK